MHRRLMAALAAAVLTSPSLSAQTVPSPREHLGFEIGADRHLADWDELTSYFEALAASPRVRVDTLGAATAGSALVMLTITSPENHARLDRLREIQRRLADPRLVADETEREALFDEGRAVVLMTHGIHATEVGSSQMSANLAYRLATSNDPGILRILDQVVVLQIPSLNPDGLQWVADWYRQNVGTEFEDAPFPGLYHYYIGHDNNRDWYAFTQAETRLTVERAHNVWHPQVVHDIHQMGAYGARIFFPPYVEPWEPNVDPALTAAVSQLGSFMASRLTADGYAGVVTNGIYDAFTPSRAYMHYHAGARILSETASATLASPVNVPARRLSPGRGYDAARRSWNHPLPWTGGEWRLADIVDYQEAGALALLEDVAAHRRFWLESFFAIGERAVEKWASWPEAWIIPAGQPDASTGIDYALRALAIADVEVRVAQDSFEVDGIDFPSGSYVIPMRQPYASFANAMLDVQRYPDLREYPGGPPERPYDVTAHTLPYLLGFEAVAVDGSVAVALSEPIDPPDFAFELPAHLTGPDAPRVAFYKSWQEPISSGWQRWMFDQYGLAYDTIHDAEIRDGGLAAYDVLVMQAQDSRSIVNGYSPTQMPEPFAGGLGERGSNEIRSFVQRGGRVVAIEGAADFVGDVLGLEITDVTERLPPADFYIPGSILRMRLEPDTPIAEGVSPETVAWYWGSSRAFEVDDDRVRIAARYGEGDPLLSGWALGGDQVAGRGAILEADVGAGSAVLFGFQPNYRGQSVATWPLLLNAIRK